MVVEDNDDIRELLSETLRDEGYAVVEAEDGQQALDLLDTTPQQPSLVLLDLMMPVMGGVEMLRILERQGRLATLPVIVVSAGGTPAQVPQATHFMAKPPDQEALVALVHKLCGPGDQPH